MGRTIARIAEEREPEDPFTIFNVSTVTGGTGVTSIASECSFTMDVRSADADVMRSFRTRCLAIAHECADEEDAMRKLRLGQFIMVREGTAAHNLEALLPLVKSPKYFDRCMFCTDDKHPSDLLEKGHIDYICREAVRMGADPIQTVQVACLHAARYFLLNNRGAIAPGYLADFAIVEDLKDFNVITVYKRGKLVYDQGVVAEFEKPVIPAHLDALVHDTFHLPLLSAKDFANNRRKVIIGMIDGQIITEDKGYADRVDTEKDILKMAVVERHKNTGHIGIGYLQG
jgi:adenine deaminase